MASHAAGHGDEEQSNPSGVPLPGSAEPEPHLIVDAPIADPLPPLGDTAGSGTGTTYHVRPPTKRAPRRRARRGVGVAVLTGTVLVVVGAMAALWWVGQRTGIAHLRTADGVSAAFLGASDFPSGWEVGSDTSVTTAAQLAANDYWADESVSDANCAVVDKSFGLLVQGQSASDQAAGSESIVSAGAAYSAQGQLVQQSARVFSSPAAATAFLTQLADAVPKCSSYSVSTSSGDVSQSISPLSTDGLTSPSVAFASSSDSGNVDVAFLSRDNIVLQVMVGQQVQGDDSSLGWDTVAKAADARLVSLPNP